MNINKELIEDYERLLLGQIERLPKIYFVDKYHPTTVNNALSLVKYLIENIMKWSPEDALDYLNDHIIERFKLTSYIKYFDLPMGMSSQKYFYILSMIYPEDVRFNSREVYLNIYQKVINKNEKFPKNFFDGLNAREKAEICLHYMIEHYLIVKDIESLYEKFSKKGIATLLKKYSLANPCNSLYASPLHYLHETLAVSQRNNFLYHFYSFKKKYEEEFKFYYHPEKLDVNE